MRCRRPSVLSAKPEANLASARAAPVNVCARVCACVRVCEGCKMCSVCTVWQSISFLVSDMHGREDKQTEHQCPHITGHLLTRLPRGGPPSFHALRHRQTTIVPTCPAPRAKDYPNIDVSECKARAELGFVCSIQCMIGFLSATTFNPGTTTLRCEVGTDGVAKYTGTPPTCLSMWC